MAEPIRIPDAIKPADGRFGSGPSKVRPEAVRALLDHATTYLGTSHRQKTVKDQVARLRRESALDGAQCLVELIALNEQPGAFDERLGFGGAQSCGLGKRFEGGVDLTAASQAPAALQMQRRGRGAPPESFRERALGADRIARCVVQEVELQPRI